MRIEEPKDADDSAECSDEPSKWWRRIRVGWRVPIAVASLLVGAVGALGATGQLSSIMASMFPDGGAVVKGDLKTADSWFDKPIPPSDAYPGIVAQSYGVGESDVQASGLTGGWVGRTDSTLCLLLLSFEAVVGPIASNVTGLYGGSAARGLPKFGISNSGAMVGPRQR